MFIQHSFEHWLQQFEHFVSTTKDLIIFLISMEILLLVLVHIFVFTLYVFSPKIFKCSSNLLFNEYILSS